MNLISLFSGAGGLDLGFEKAGFHTVLANEYDKNICPTFRANFPNTQLIEGDIRKLDTSILPTNITGIIGGPPCQSWSTGGSKRGLNDKRGQLFWDYIRILNAKNPKFFVAENVKGLLSIEGGKVFKMIKSDFENLKDNEGNVIGYKVDACILNAAEYGVPQARERVVIIGNRIIY